MPVKAKYRKMSQEEKELMYKLFEKKIELRKIAKTLERTFSTVQYY